MNKVNPPLKKHAISVDEKSAPIFQKPLTSAKALFYATLCVGIVLGGNLVFRMVVYRTIGTYETGVLTLALSIISIASIVVALGIPTAITRFVSVPSDAYEQSSYILTGATLILVQGALTLLLLFFTMPWISGWLNVPQLVEFRWIIVLAVLLSTFTSFWEAVYNGWMRLDIKAAINASNQVVRILGAVIFIALGITTVQIGLVAVLSGLFIANLWGVRLAWKLWRQWRVGFHWRYARKLSPFGLYQFGTIAMDQIVYNTSTFLIGRLLTAHEVGIYAVATLLGQLVLILPSAAQMITYPRMAKYWEQQNREALACMVNGTIRISLVSLLPLVFTLSYLRVEIIQLIFGSSFVEAASPLVILLVGYLFSSVVSRPLGASMAAIDKPSMDMVRSFLAAFVNVGFNLLLLPRWKLAGAAWATTFSFITTSCIFQGLLVKFTKLSLSKRPLAIAALLGGITGLLYLPVITGIIWRWLFGIVGGILLMALGVMWGLTSTDRRYWMNEYMRLREKIRYDKTQTYCNR